MFCPNCGAPNTDGVSFCTKCGASLGGAASPVQAAAQGGYSGSVPASARKNKWVAAILNLFFGLGYLYLGYKKVFGMRTILFVLVVFIVDIVIGIFTFGLISLILAIAFAYDGYVKAKGGKGYIGTEPAMLYQP